MTLEEVIVTETAALAVSYPLVMPADATLPCIVYQVISGPELQVATYVQPRVQFACWATTYGAAVTLGRAVRSRFYNRHVTIDGLHYRSLVINSLDGNPDLDAGLFVRLVDVRFEYRNPT